MTANGARGEVVAVLAGAERRLCLTLGALAEIWRHGSVVRSWLLDLTADALARAASAT